MGDYGLMSVFDGGIVGDGEIVGVFGIVVVATLRQVRFLLPQEWSTGGRNIFDDFTLEIPVYAGMVCPAACTAVAAMV